MTSPALRRLVRDLQKMEEDPSEGINATPVDDSLMQWEAVIMGPEETMWEGGIFKLKMVFSEEYPNKAPDVKFVNKIFHPNVYKDGSIWIDILSHHWSPIYDVWAILTSLQSLLCDPNPNSPANSEAAKLFVDNPKEYKRRVIEWVEASWEDGEDDQDNDADNNEDEQMDQQDDEEMKDNDPDEEEKN